MNNYTQKGNNLIKHQKIGYVFINDTTFKYSKNIANLLEIDLKNIKNFILEIDEIKGFLKSDKNKFIVFKKFNINHKTKYIKIFGKQIEKCIFLVFEDFTDLIKELNISKTLYKLNRLFKYKSENKIFKEMINIILNSADFAAAFIMVKKQDKLIPIAWGNKLEDNLECIKDVIIPINDFNPALKTPVAKAFLEENIFFNDNTFKNPDVEVLKDEMLKRNYLSSVGIPFFKNKKPYGAICICHNEIDYFKKFKKLLKEFSNILSFSLDLVEEEKNKNLIQKALDKGHEWVLITDKEGNIIYVNNAVCKISGYSKKELIGANPRIFKSGKHPKVFYENLWNTILQGKIFENLIINKAKNGKLFYLIDKIIPFDEFFISLAKDITKEKRYIEKISELKNYDLLTGLLNKDTFFYVAKKLLKKFENKKNVLIRIDIYNFSYYNSEYGAETGDEILKKFAKILDSFLNIEYEKITGRLSADDFIIAIFDVENNLTSILDKLDELLKKPIEIKKHIINLHYNAGVSLYPEDSKDINQLLNYATLALKEAQEKGVNIIEIFSKEYKEKLYKFNEAVELIKYAFDNNKFKLFFQPYVDTFTQNIEGAESLIRIEKNGKIISPYFFIEVLENSKYLDIIDLLLLEKIEKIIKNKNIKLSFNLSKNSFKNRETISKILEIGEKYPYKLQIELIERTLIDDVKYTKDILNKFKKSNILIALDDFGTGYSSLSYLREFPIDILKIDMSFIKSMMENDIDLKLVKSIINLSKELNIKTIAEGVETKEQYSILKTFNCDYIQGYYFYKPMSEKEFLRLI